MSFKQIGLDIARGRQSKTHVGTVIDNDDPKQLGRCRIRVVALHGTKGEDALLPWANPIQGPGHGAAVDIGTLIIPRINSAVYYELLNSDLYTPIFFSSPVSVPNKLSSFAANYPNRYGHRDPNGNKFEVNLTDDSITITLQSGVTITIAANGDLTIATTGNDITLDPATTQKILANTEITGTLEVSSGLGVNGSTAPSQASMAAVAAGGADSDGISRTGINALRTILVNAGFIS